ncbi:MAG: methyltransferase domain-containing protein [Acidobacteria bacterium]|nr:methyltransferase domain-containing protein [Acidobacteriota bacterium]
MDGIAAPPLARGRTRKRAAQSLPAMLADIGKRLVLVAVVMAGALALTHFPWDTDKPLSKQEIAELEKYYATAYQNKASLEEEPVNSDYVRIAEGAAAKANVKEAVGFFVKEHGLGGKKVLDVGAGRGYLQDLVDDYTGLDISPSAKRFFHKKFVHASATYMPFQEGEFDGLWTIWVLEHVPNPEAALAEMRRVVKDGGVLLLSPAWNCRPWAADGYPVRPYSDFGAGGKLYKAAIPALEITANYARFPVRLIRHATWKVTGEPTHLRYRRIKPNYDQYWMADSDAINALDRHEVARWFLSRGDECLNCDSGLNGLTDPDEALVIRLHKKPKG